MRTYLPPTQITPKPLLFNQPVFAFDEDLAIYTRQSTKEQVLKNCEAYDQQTIGLVKQA